MTKEQFLKGITFLTIAYNKEFTEEQVSVWYEFFRNDDYEVFRNAVKRIIPKNQFMPSIAELKQEIANISNPILQLDIDEEWNNVIQAIRKYGYYRVEEALNSLNEYTRQIVRTIGWYRLCMSENIEWERKTFKELFNNKQDRYEDVLVLSEPTMTLAELTTKAKLKEQEMLEQKETKLIGG